MNSSDEENARLQKLASMAKLGWWEADFNEGVYYCSEFLIDLLGLKEDKITFSDFINLICEEYRDRVEKEFKSFKMLDVYEQIFPMQTQYGIMWVSTKVGDKRITEEGHVRILGMLQCISRQRMNTHEQTMNRINDLLYQLNGISRSLLSFLHSDNTEEIINKILGDILHQYHGDRTYIIEYDQTNHLQHCTYEITSAAISPQWIGTSKILNTEKWWNKQILCGNPIILSSSNEFPDEASEERQSLAEIGVKSIMAVPLVSKGGIWGYIGIEIICKYREWNNEDYLWFCSLANIISLCMELRKAEETALDAKEKAETADRLKSAFLANMSHEIRTPLNAIVGFSSLLVEEENRKERDQYMSIVNDNTELLLQLISDILDLSKIESETFEFTKRNVDIGSMCNEIICSLKIKAPKEVELRLDNELSQYFIYTDKNRLVQVISNFINNALKFTAAGHITLGYRQTDSHHLKFYVRDTGIGIPADKTDCIFERFVKLNSFVHGTGLGLSICKSIVKQMEGQIGVDSVEGEGSCFWFIIPM